MSDIRGTDAQGHPRDIQVSSRGAIHSKPALWHYVDDQQLSSTSGAAFALTRPAAATFALVHVRSANIYYDYGAGSTTPASTQGDEAYIGDVIPIVGRSQIDGFRAVRQASANFTLKVLYYREVAYDGAD